MAVDTSPSDTDLPHDRTGLWLPLLRRLTAEVDSWVVWKAADTAFSGTEDIDAAAPRSAWPDVERAFREWASESSLDVVVCRHIPQTLNLFALVEDGRSLLQLEVKDQTSLRGSVLFRARDLVALSHLHPLGYRALLPGAEAVLKLTLHGLRRGGLPNAAALAEHHVREKLVLDPGGAEAATRLYGPAQRPLMRAVRAAADGGWDRRAMLEVEGWAAVRALVQPQVGARRWWFRRVTRARCPVLQSVYVDQRRIRTNPDEWLALAARAHAVIPRGGSPALAGRFVALVGPDGVGKTTVARELLERHGGAGGYVYFRPPLNGSLAALPPEGPRPRGDKHPRRQPMVLGWLRLLKNIAWFWIGYLRVVRPLVRRGGLVVGDRWAYSYAVQPGPLAFFGPEWLGRLGIRLMPQPDLVINLSAPPGVIVARKDELSAEQAALELDRWRKLPVPRLETFDASVPASEVVDAIEARLADSQPRIEPVGS